MNDQFDDIYDTFLALLDLYTPTEAVKRLEMMVAPDLAQRIRERYESQAIKVRELEEPRTVVRENRETWYTGPSPRDKCWPAIVELLKKSGWSDSSIQDVDSASNRIVSLLNHPKESSFSTRGLVVGYVQSGKPPTSLR